MFQRFHFQPLASSIESPRQVGKTTLTGQILSASTIPGHYISADAVPNSNAVWLDQ